MAYGTGGRVDKHEQKEKGKQTETKKSPEKREQTGGKAKARAREQAEVQEINHEDLALKRPPSTSERNCCPYWE